MSFPIAPVAAPVSIQPPIQTIALPASIQPTGQAHGSFQSVFSDALGQVQQLQQTANTSVSNFLSGENVEIHHVALATQQSELAFELFMQVRNKVVQAYQEVMRMQM